MHEILGVCKIALVLMMIYITWKCWKIVENANSRVQRLLAQYERTAQLMDRIAHQDVFLAKFDNKGKDVYHVRN